MTLSLSGDITGTWLANVGNTTAAGDGRSELKTDFVSLILKTTGGIGYPAVWSFQQFSDALCDAARSGRLLPLVDIGSRIKFPWAGRQLALGMLGAMKQPPPYLSRDSCDVEWTFHVCDDENVERCDMWARAGECSRNPTYMLDSCRRACGMCDG